MRTCSQHRALRRGVACAHAQHPGGRGRRRHPLRDEPGARRTRLCGRDRGLRDDRSGTGTPRPTAGGAARPRPSGRRRTHSARDDPSGQRCADHRGHRAGRRPDDRPRPGRWVPTTTWSSPSASSRSPPGSARCCAAEPRRGGPEPVRVGDLAIDERARIVDPCRIAGWTSRARSSTSCWLWRSRRARWSPSASCWPRCGSSRTAARTGPSTSTCRGCAASSARPQPHRATCTPCGASACASPDPGEA